MEKIFFSYRMIPVRSIANGLDCELLGKCITSEARPNVPDGTQPHMNQGSIFMGHAGAQKES